MPMTEEPFEKYLDREDKPKRKKTTKKERKESKPPESKYTAEAPAPKSVCPRCQSTERSPYMGNAIIQQMNVYGCDQQYCSRFSTRIGDTCCCGGTYSVRYTKIVRRRTKCEQCGQHRLDLHLENEQ